MLKKNVHVYMLDAAGRLAFKEHCIDRILHFEEVGSKYGVKYWRARLASVAGEGE